MELNKIETFETLDKIGYHDLSEKFKELGVGEAWSAGKKKVDLINKALEMLAQIKEKEDIKKNRIPEIGEEEKAKAKEVEGVDKAKEKQAKKEKAAARAKAKAEKEDAEALANIPKIEDYVEKINRVDMNLLNNVPGHRQILLSKKAEYVAKFKEFFKMEWEAYERTL